MLAESGADADQRGSFLAMIRGVADARKVSVHDILSPPIVQTFRFDRAAGRMLPRLTFDPYAGWSWREVLVWFSDITRVARQRQQAESDARWREQAQRTLEASLRSPD